MPFGMVTRNWREALRIFLVPAILGMLVVAFGTAVAGVFADNTAVIIGLLMVLVVAIVYVTLWTVVAWHRFVLLEEAPTGWLPRLSKKHMASYFVAGLKIFLVSFLIGIPVGFVLGFFGQLLGSLNGRLVQFGLMFIVAVLAYRWVAILPAAAIGQPIGMKNAYEATKGATGAIILVLAISFGLGFAAELVVTAVSKVLPIIGVALDLVAASIIGLINVSVLTTFYGHYVEGRPID